METARPPLPPMPTVVVFTDEYTREVLQAHGWHIVQPERSRLPPYNFFPRTRRGQRHWWYILTPGTGRWYPVGAGPTRDHALRSALRNRP